MVGALVRSVLLVVVSLLAAVGAQRLLGRTFLTDDPDAISTFLASLASFAAVPVTIAFGVIVLVIQQQASTYTGRAGALVTSSPGFLFVVALLFEVPLVCIVLLGALDLGGESAPRPTRVWAAAAMGPVLLNLLALAGFASVWFRRVNPSEFSKFMFDRARDEARKGNRNTVSLALRGLGESLNNLARSTDYTGLHLCMNFVGAFLQEYVGGHKRRLLDRRPSFFEYQFPEKKTDNVWVEREACTFVRDATDELLGRLAPAESVYYLVDGLLPLGQVAVEAGDLEALEVLCFAFAEMGTTERTFGMSVNFNTRPLERSAEGALWARQNGYADAEGLLSSVFFLLFAYLHYHVRKMGPGGFTSAIHETKAREMKQAGVDLSAAAKASRERFNGYWIIRFPDPDYERDRALDRTRRL